MFCNCSKHSPVDQEGDHFCVCKKGKEVNSYHTAVVNVLAALCKHAGTRVTTEPRNRFAAVEVEEDQNKRPDLEITGLYAQPILGDVGIAYPISSQLTLTQARKPGRVANTYAANKTRKYNENAVETDNIFIPFIFETNGHWDPQFKKFFGKIIERDSETTGIPAKVLRTYWRRRISATLQKAVAKGIIAKTKRANSPGFYDQSNYELAILDQADDAVLLEEESYRDSVIAA